MKVTIQVPKEGSLDVVHGSPPWDAIRARLVERLAAGLVVIHAPGIHHEPQVFALVRKTRRDGWCRVTATPLPKGSRAFTPLRRAAAYCYISAIAVERTKVGEYLSLANTGDEARRQKTNSP